MSLLNQIRGVSTHFINSGHEVTFIMDKDWDYPHGDERKSLRWDGKVVGEGTADENRLWYAEMPNGLVSFYSHVGDDKNHGGFGGMVTELTMKDGSTKTLKGPWSSRPGVMNKYGFGPCTHVGIRGKYNLACNVTADLFKQACAKFLPDFDVYKVIDQPKASGLSEFSWRIWPKGETPPVKSWSPEIWELDNFKA